MNSGNATEKSITFRQFMQTLIASEKSGIGLHFVKLALHYLDIRNLKYQKFVQILLHVYRYTAQYKGSIFYHIIEDLR